MLATGGVTKQLGLRATGSPNAIYGKPSGATRAGRAQGLGKVPRLSRPQGSTHVRLPTSGPLREDVDLDGDAAGVDGGITVLVIGKGFWSNTARP